MAPEQPTRPPLDDQKRIQILLGTTRPGPAWSRVGQMLKSLGAFARTWLKASTERIIIYAAVGFAVGWLFNALVIIVGYNGYAKVPVGGPATGQGNEAAGSVFCFVLTAILVAVITQARRAGPGQFARSVTGFPATLASLGREDGTGALAHFAWGFAGTMLVVSIISPFIAGVLAAGFVLALVGVFRSLLTGLLMLGWRRLVHVFRPDRDVKLTSAALTVGGMGGLAAVAAGLLVPDKSQQGLLVVLAVVLAAVISYRRATAAAATLVLLGLGLLTARALVVYASDGGFSECGGNLLNCPGLDVGLYQATIGGLASAAGAVVGALIGDVKDWPPTNDTGPP